MPWYTVKVKGDDLETAERALSGGMTFRVSKAYAGWAGAGGPELVTLAAIVEADDADDAKAQVLETLPGDDWDLATHRSG